MGCQSASIRGVLEPTAGGELVVTTKQPVLERVALLDEGSINKIKLCLKSTVISESVKATLQVIRQRGGRGSADGCAEWVKQCS